MIYLKFLATLHAYYKTRDSDPEIWVFMTSTAIVGLALLFVHDTFTFYFFEQKSLERIGAIFLFSAVAGLNYLVAFRSGSYLDADPSLAFRIGVVMFIIAVIGFGIFIATQYRQRVQLEKVQSGPVYLREGVPAMQLTYSQ